jgi:hypothetical protein
MTDHFMQIPCRRYKLDIALVPNKTLRPEVSKTEPIGDSATPRQDMKVEEEILGCRTLIWRN